MFKLLKRWFTSKESLARHLKPNFLFLSFVFFLGQDNWTNLTILFWNRCFIILSHSNCLLNNIKVLFLLWNLRKQCYLALKKLHNLLHNSPILSHNLPWKCRLISAFLSHPIRRPVSTIATTLQVYFPVYPITFGFPCVSNYPWSSQLQIMFDLCLHLWSGHHPTMGTFLCPKDGHCEDHNLTLFHTKSPTQ